MPKTKKETVTEKPNDDAFMMYSDLEKEIARLKKENELVHKLRKENDDLRDALRPPSDDFIRTTKAVVSFTRNERDVFLQDEEFRTLAIELFRLAPRKHRFRRDEIQEKKMQLFERFKQLLITDYHRNTGEMHTRWSVAGINVMGAHFDKITSTDKILLIARHPAALQCKDVPKKLATKNGIEFRVKLAIHAHDFHELMDEIVSLDKYGR